jgi:protein-L-isoaspartate(D-aspartate) O-methyltransferase
LTEGRAWQPKGEKMTSETDLQVIRRAYAKQIMAAVQVSDVSIENAFASIRREDFLGPGPWPIFRHERAYVLTPTDDPVYIYTDDRIGIDPERKINNGQPSLHAYLMANAGIKPGDHVVHVGAGAGYYSAIMATLAEAHGRVTAIEFEPDLVERARYNLKPWPNVQVKAGSGATAEFDIANVIYVNAGTTRPADIWLDRLADGGRLVLPLTTNEAFRAKDTSKMQKRGAVFVITRRGGDFDARWISPVAVYPCEGMRDDFSEQALVKAFEREEWRKVTKLYRRDDLPAERCWLRGAGWSLAYN